MSEQIIEHVGNEHKFKTTKNRFSMDYRPQIESGEYQVTRDGKPVQIVKWDCKGSCPILAVVEGEDGSDKAMFFTEQGCDFTEGLWLTVEIPCVYNELEWAIESLIEKIDSDYACEIPSYNEYIKEFAPIVMKAAENLLPKWKKVTGELYCKEAVLAKRADGQQLINQTDIFEGYTVAADHTLTPNNYKYYIKISELEKLPIDE